MTKVSSKQRTSYRHGNVYDEAIATALSMLQDTSYETLSVREIAKRIGVAHRAISNEFGSKDLLFNAVATEGFKQQADVVGKATTTSEFIELYLRFGLAKPHLYDLMTSRPHGTMKNFPDLQAAVHQVITKAMILFTDPSGDHLENRRIVMKTYTFLHGALSLRAAGILDFETDDDFISETQRMVVQGV